MSTGAIVAIVIGAVALVVLIALALRAAQNRRLGKRRERAHEVRQQAQARSVHAEGVRASADEQAARARRANAEAQEKAAQARRDSAAAKQQASVAEREMESARSHHDRARAIDPDAADSGEDEAYALDDRRATAATREDAGR